jgi:predicted helicase
LQLFEIFLGYDIPTIRDPEQLAEALARRARFLKDLAKEQLNQDNLAIAFYRDDPSSWSEKVSSIYDFHEVLHQLIEETSIQKGIETTVDAYAQTITYGLFLARYNSEENIERNTAYKHIPESVPIIRTIFRNIADEEKLPSNVSWILDELTNVLNATKMQEAMSKVSENGNRVKDPFYMFYEHFLDIYDPDKKKKMGVYYTPESVVQFIVKSLHSVLKNDFAPIRAPPNPSTHNQIG